MKTKIAEYQDAVKACALARALLQVHDIPGMLRAIDQAEGIGPILDPTLYREKEQAMREDRALLQAALPLATFTTPRLRAAEDVRKRLGLGGVGDVLTFPDDGPRSPNEPKEGWPRR